MRAPVTGALLALTLAAAAPSAAGAADAPIYVLAVDPDEAGPALRRAAGAGQDVEVARLDSSLYATGRLVLGGELESFCAVPSLTPPEFQSTVEFATSMIDNLEMETGRATLERARSRLVCLTEWADGEALWGFHFAEAVAEFYATGSTASAQPALRRALSMRPGEGYDPAYPPQLETVYLSMQTELLGKAPATIVATPGEEVWMDGVPMGLVPAPVVPGEHLLQFVGGDGTIRGGFVTLAPDQVLAVGDPKTLGDALEGLAPTLRATLAGWLRPRAAVPSGVRVWVVDGSNHVVPLEGPTEAVTLGGRAPEVPLLAAIGGGYAAADEDSYGAIALDVSVGLVGPLRLHAWARVTIGAGVPSETDGAVRVPILVPFGFGPELRLDGPVDPFVSVCLQLGIDQEGTEAYRLHPDVAPLPEAVPLGGLLLSGGVAIPLGGSPLELRAVGEGGFLGRHPVVRGLVSIGVGVGGTR